MGECFAPRFRASHRARILGLGLTASIAFALAGCTPTRPSTECVNSLSSERVRVIELGWGKRVRDSEGYEFWIDNDSPVWRCKDLRR
jgi:hypothetical protein